MGNIVALFVGLVMDFVIEWLEECPPLFVQDTYGCVRARVLKYNNVWNVWTFWLVI